MDQITHLALGGALAQLPHSHEKQSQPLDWKKRAIIGASAALFPDIDYVLFFYQPLDFIAYWHRAETHSLLLAPLFALLLTFLWKLAFRRLPTLLVFYIILIAICSHSLLDSFTPFGTQLFAPITRITFSWNLLYVVDAYFTLLVFLVLFSLIAKTTTVKRVLVCALPFCYVLFVVWIKSTVTETIRANPNHANSVVLPQPFSPFYWKVVSPLENGFAMSFVEVVNDPVAVFVSNNIGYPDPQEKYTSLNQPKWQRYPLLPESADSDMVATAWQNPKFKAFRDFAHFPVFLYTKESAEGRCHWFADLRYFETYTVVYFRYAMCWKEGEWKVVRGEYF